MTVSSVRLTDTVAPVQPFYRLTFLRDLASFALIDAGTDEAVVGPAVAGTVVSTGARGCCCC